MSIFFRIIRFDADHCTSRHGQAAIGGIRIGCPHTRTITDDVTGVPKTLVCNTQCKHWVCQKVYETIFQKAWMYTSLEFFNMPHNVEIMSWKMTVKWDVFEWNIINICCTFFESDVIKAVSLYVLSQSICNYTNQRFAVFSLLYFSSTRTQGNAIDFREFLLAFFICYNDSLQQ